MLGHEQSLGPDDLHHVDPAVARTFVKLQEILQQKKRIDGDKSHVSHSLILLQLHLMLGYPSSYIIPWAGNCPLPSVDV